MPADFPRDVGSDSLVAETSAFVLPFENRGLDPGTALDLARSLAASPLWKAMHEAILVVREEPASIAILGRFSEAEEARILALAHQLPSTLDRLRYVSYEEVETLCARLAGRLLDNLGSDALSEAFFEPIPRGGLVTLGLLSYALGLRPDQLAGPPPGDGLLVVVDDCALTGLRFQGFLEGRRGRSIAFATLLSHPELRQRILEREADVVACESAEDLRDHARELQGDRYEEWKRNWTDRSDPGCYWVGLPDHLCFPWSEPTLAIWNPVTASEEAGWRIGSATRCYANRLAAASGEVQVQPRGPGPLGPPPSIVFGESRGEILAADTRSGRAIRLGETAGDIWRAIVRFGTVERAADDLAERYEVDEPQSRKDVERFVAELLSGGFLERRST